MDGVSEQVLTTTGPVTRPGIAVVTGANSGIGRQIARQLIAQGLTVHVGSRDPARGQAAVDELGPGAHLLVLDVTDEQSVTRAAGQVPQLDVLINNAGISDNGTPPAGPTWRQCAGSTRRTCSGS